MRSWTCSLLPRMPLRIRRKKGKMLAIHTDEEGKSHMGKRAFPTPNKPDPMPDDLAFLFTKISSKQMMYLWNVYTALFVGQCSWVVLYCIGLRFFGETWQGWCWCTGVFAPVFMELMVQNVYCLHDVLHGATFPPYKWQNYITHPWADILSLPWEDVVLEHQRHHASTVDLLIHGEFGWDPANWLYTLAEFSWLTTPLVPLWHWLGANDTGSIFALLWWTQFPDEATGGKCNKAFWTKWVPTRVKHNLFVWTLWSCVWLLGTYPLGRPLSEGWRFMFTVLTVSRAGFAVAWMFIANFNHSHMWNEFLASDPDRNWPKLHAFMAFVLGGRHRFNEMLFHDLHHAFPNAVGALSQRGRFHGWKKVHDACTRVLELGLWKEGHHAEHAAGHKMRDLQQRRSSIKVRNNGALKAGDKYISVA
eukprot:gnl/TRDRNA2_/TRDRNA2_172214_c0_seq2.p1 gnl/TRDRNA2_/TRDRNA2_172214_c0~~gnl/TRDRNA2_/TRDRNA2_172214_c0_seq2.p1  ORF type:complete len:418 (-),score=53.65 gnl/TRDRNA2_/TRDRNA2_172214_c0_seq2:162-1415(-)